MKKVKLLTIAVSVFLAMICYSVSAFALTEGDWEFQLLDNEVTITDYLGVGGDIVIPDTIYGCPVTKIEQKNQSILQNATSVVFPKNLKVLNSLFSQLAWIGAENLEKVVLPEGLEEIDNYAFGACEKLSEINIPSTVKRIGQGAFEGCKSLTKITLPGSVQVIEDSAFRGSGLTEIDLTSLNATYGDDLFAECESLKSAKLSPSMQNISKGMFNKCYSLSKVELNGPISKIDERAFYCCKTLEQIILPTSLNEIQSEAFSGTNLKEILIPYGTEKISDCFSECKNLKSIYMPDTVTNISSIIINDSPNCIIYCTADSYTAEFCKQNRVSYLTDNSVNSGIHVLYNGTRISFHSYGQNPELLESRTLVPLRSIFEAMGADVEWDGATSTAIAKRSGVEIKIQIGADEMYKDGKAIPVDVPAMLLNSRTMVPVRVIAEAFGADVQWNGNGRTVLITE